MSDTFFNKQPTDLDNEMVYTMGGLDSLPVDSNSGMGFDPNLVATQGAPFDFSNFIGTASQLAQLFPGVQTKPNYVPGLTDITFTRGFSGPGETVSPESYGTESGGTLFWQGSNRRPVYTAPATPGPVEDTYNGELEAGLLGGLLSSMATAAASPEAQAQALARAEAGATKISNVFTPTNTFTPTNVNTFNPDINISQSQTQSQQQWQGGSGGSGQSQSSGKGTPGGGLDSIVDSNAFDYDALLAALAAAGVIGGGIAAATGGSKGGGTSTGGGTTTGGGTSTDSSTDDETFDADLGTINQGTTTNTTGTGSTATTGTAVDEATQQANDEFVRQTYEKLFNRPAEQEGLDYWSNQLDMGKSQTDLLRDIMSSARGADVQTGAYTKTVDDLYNQLLDRPADEAGLDYYRAQLAAGATPDEVAQNIISGARAGEEASKISQAEYDRYFPPSANEAFVKDAYRNLFGREADPEGLAQWTSQLDAGVPQTELVGRMLAGAQGEDAARVQQYSEKANELQQYANSFIANSGNLVGAVPEEIRAEFLRSLMTDKPGLFNDILGNAGEIGAAITAVNALLGAETGGEAAKNLVEGFGTTALSQAATYALAAQGLPVVGQVVGAAIMIDAFLSDALGYDSPIQDAISFLANGAEDVVNWTVNRAIGGDPLGAIGRSIGRVFGFQGGGLVDLPGEIPYNYTNYYGNLSQPVSAPMTELPSNEVLPEMAFAGGGLIPLLGGGKVARGPGGGLDDLIPTSIDGKRAAALSDGEFVIPADVVSMMGDGSSNAGAKRLYDLVRQIRQEKTGTSKQAGPLPVGKILERTMS